MASPRLAPLAALAALTLSLTACTGQDPAVSIAEARAAEAASQAEEARERVWAHVGPFGIPSMGWTWIIIVATIVIAAIIITGMSMLYWNRQNRREAEKLFSAQRKEIALELAKRPNCVACGFNPAEHEHVQATVRTADEKARALAAEAT